MPIRETGVAIWTTRGIVRRQAVVTGGGSKNINLRFTKRQSHLAEPVLMIERSNRPAKMSDAPTPSGIAGHDSPTNRRQLAMGSLEGKIAIVTGGTGGIGKGIALALASRGATIMITGRSASKAKSVLDELRKVGGRADFLAGDVRSKADMDALAAETARRYGGIDIIVANAGGNDDEARSPQVRGPFSNIDLSRVAAVVAENTTAKLFPVQAVLPYMRPRGEGSIIFVTSEGGRVPTPGQTAVSTFAGGLIRASKVIAKELARDRIRVNCVCVTVVRDSPSWEAVFGEDSSVSEHHRKQYEKIVEGCPLGVATPVDIGHVVAFLASSESAYLTGATLSPTGGLTIH